MQRATARRCAAPTRVAPTHRENAHAAARSSRLQRERGGIARHEAFFHAKSRVVMPRWHAARIRRGVALLHASHAPARVGMQYSANRLAARMARAPTAQRGASSVANQQDSDRARHSVRLRPGDLSYANGLPCHAGCCGRSQMQLQRRKRARAVRHWRAHHRIGAGRRSCMHTARRRPMIRVSRCVQSAAQDWAHPCHGCTGTGLTPATAAPGLASARSGRC
jgi:hypothetical protein